VKKRIFKGVPTREEKSEARRMRDEWSAWMANTTGVERLVRSAISRADMETLVAQRATAALSAGINAGPRPSAGAVVGFGVAGLAHQSARGDLFLTFTVGGRVVREACLRGAAPHEAELRAWVIWFNNTYGT
jgi:hypothetical protein